MYAIRSYYAEATLSLIPPPRDKRTLLAYWSILQQQLMALLHLINLGYEAGQVDVGLFPVSRARLDDVQPFTEAVFKADRQHDRNNFV